MDEIGPYLEWISMVMAAYERKAMPSPPYGIIDKYVRTGRESGRRGRELEELIGELDLEVLNRQSDLFTFSGQWKSRALTSR